MSAATKTVSPLDRLAALDDALDRVNADGIIAAKRREAIEGDVTCTFDRRVPGLLTESRGEEREERAQAMRRRASRT